MDEDFVRDLFEGQGPVRIRRMFGGHGVWLDDRIVAVIFRDEIFLKSDEVTAAFFEDAGARRWSYGRAGKPPVMMPYHALPSEAYDDPDAMTLWARRANEAAGRAGRKQPRSRQKR
ncbi:TfoX/Sxy family protein [Aureimonas psammosilenae]|uniref:TfoX/Sxy family protein n=1 Tax=Aureimonas psammosilenae TaxID=2495496 RepID=UPI00126114EB|nr:TfoX/Sxy family protein [Aureimonas psammosilenae]